MRRGLLAAAGALLLCVALTAGGAAGAEPAATQVTTWQGGVLRDGHTAGESFAPPLTTSWQVSLREPSHALVARGRAFVVSNKEMDPVDPLLSGNLLHAFDVATGERLWGPVDLGGSHYSAAHALADGRVLTVNVDGLVRAHEETTGLVLWSLQLANYSFDSPPAVYDGVVYVSGSGYGGRVYAIDVVTGLLLWEQSAGSGSHTAPVVTQDDVFVTSGCGTAYSLRRSDGAPQWLRRTPCDGGGGPSAALHEGLLYVRDSSYAAVLDARTGEPVRSLATELPPAFHEGIGYFVEEGRLVARQASTGALLWRAGDGDLHTAPYVAGGHVYVGTPAALVAFREHDGQQVWRGDVAVDDVDEFTGVEPYGGITVAESTVFVPSWNTLSALRGVAPTGPPLPLPTLPAPGPSDPPPSPAPAPSGPPEARSTDDACPPGEVPEDGAGDVPDSNTHEDAVDCVVWWEVAAGKGPGRYAPADAVARGQMATFLVRLLAESGAPLPPASSDRFADDEGSVHEDSINRLAEAGIVAGRADGDYGPDLVVSRDAMATFLVRTYEHRSGSALAGGGDHFSDDDGNTHEESIDKAANAGLTGGAADGGYRPAQPVRRDQMGSFLARVLDLAVDQGFTAPPSRR